MKFLNSFIFLWVIFALLVLDRDPLTYLDPDPKHCLAMSYILLQSVVDMIIPNVIVQIFLDLTLKLWHTVPVRSGIICQEDFYRFSRMFLCNQLRSWPLLRLKFFKVRSSYVEKKADLGFRIQNRAAQKVPDPTGSRSQACFIIIPVWSVL